MTIETLRSRFFGSSHQLRMSRGSVTCCQVCGLRFWFVRQVHALKVSDYCPEGFLHPKHHNPKFEKICYLSELFLLKCTFEDNFLTIKTLEVNK